jgi:large subunit ribosomal protein L9
MRVLLTQNVESLGRAGDIKEVATGYAHNYLLPRKLAVPATEGALKQSQAMKDAEVRRKERKATEAQTLVNLLTQQVVTFHSRAGEGDRLYGSITNADIADALSRAIGREVERRLIDIEHPIKALGDHQVTVKVGAGATATVIVRVERAAEPA